MDEHHALVRAETRRDWERARQAAAIESLLALFNYRSVDLLPFEEVRRSLRLGQKNYRGLRDIPTSQIVGSVGRYRDFTRTFLPRRERLRQRWERVNAVAYARGVPPIEVYQVGEAFFVLDGNHRVSVAKQNGSKTIQGHVWEFTTPVGLSGQADLDELLIKSEYSDFLELTRLDQLRPEQNIQFTAPGRYPEIAYQITLYRQALEQIDGEPISYEDAVTAWYDMVYTPALQIIQQRGVLAGFPGRTEADLFIWVWRYTQELQQRQGITSMAKAVDDLMSRGKMRWFGHRLRAIWERVFGKRT